MAIQTNTMIVRYKLLTKLVALWKSGELLEKIDYLPIQLSPRNSKVLGRCCIHKERAVWKYKALPLLGYDMSDERDELMPLSEYAKNAVERKKPTKENVLCVIDEACSSCVSVKYQITDLCRGCVARSCYMNCPRDAVYFCETGQAKIDHSKCISCGTCQKSCPYHAIVYVPIPCEEVCPVGAISKNEFGVEQIDETKCIYCGKCLITCPFGAIFEISNVFDVLEAIREGKKVIAMPAPSVLAQFKDPIEKVYGALHTLGFSEIVEVAEGAMTTTETEGEELLERLEKGAPFMTTSCCPSYMQMVKKHAPQLAEFVSDTKSPMYYTAELVKKRYPDAKTVFIGPCVAKRKEAKDNPNVDYVMTFEEIHAVLKGMEIDISSCEPYELSKTSYREAHAFGKTGGVSLAVTNYLKERADGVTISQMVNLDKKNISLLKSYGKSRKSPTQFIEVMSCPEGCITGPVTFNPDARSSDRIFQKALANVHESYAENYRPPVERE